LDSGATHNLVGTEDSPRSFFLTRLVRQHGARFVHATLLSVALSTARLGIFLCSKARETRFNERTCYLEGPQGEMRIRVARPKINMITSVRDSRTGKTSRSTGDSTGACAAKREKLNRKMSSGRAEDYNMAGALAVWACMGSRTNGVNSRSYES
jgi:hypothetical protein